MNWSSGDRVPLESSLSHVSTDSNYDGHTGASKAAAQEKLRSSQRRCGELVGQVARREADGRPFNAMDAHIAATAHVHELTLVTRNISDFKASLKSLLNPWT